MLAWYVASGRTPINLSFRALQFDRRLFVEILRVGAPMSLQPVLNNLALATLTGFVATLGAAQLAGFGAAVRLSRCISRQPGFRARNFQHATAIDARANCTRGMHHQTLARGTALPWK